MKRILLLSLPIALFAACGPAVKKGCKDTGCSAGSVCNPVSNACETINVGGGGGSQGGGTGGGTGGGGTGGGSMGGGGGSTDGGVDAGPPVDPFDDGGVFVPGDICTYALPVTFDGGTTSTVSVDLAAASHQYKAACNRTTGEGNDLVFAVTLTEPKGLIVTATDTSGKAQDGVLALVNSPCALFEQAACSDENTGPEVLTMDRLPAGTWYVLLENYADDATGDGTYDVQFELIDPVAGPANDTCSAAQDLTFTAGTVTVNGSTAGAFNDTGGQPLTCSMQSALAPEVFYKFTLTQPQDVVVTVDAPATSNLSPVIALTTTCGVGGAANHLGCDRAVGNFTARSVPAGTYFLVVDGDDSGTGDFTLTVTISPPTPLPMNDTCSAPATLVPNMSQTIDLSGAVADYGFACSFVSGGDAVFQFTTTQAQRVVITATAVGNSDAVLAIRSAPCDDAMSEVRCANNAGSSNPEILINNNLPAGTWYVILGSDGVDAQFGIELALQTPIPPPTNDSCTLPEVVTLTAGTATRSIDLTLAQADITVDCNGDPDANGADVVYAVTIPAMQTLTVDANPVGLAVDPVLFSTSPACISPPAVCENSGFGGDSESIAVPNMTPGPVTVFVVVKAYSASSPGVIDLTFTAM